MIESKHIAAVERALPFKLIALCAELASLSAVHLCSPVRQTEHRKFRNCAASILAGRIGSLLSPRPSYMVKPSMISRLTIRVFINQIFILRFPEVSQGLR